MYKIEMTVDNVTAFQLFCKLHSKCENCPMKKAINKNASCFEFVYNHPEEAAKVMGFEYIT